MRSSHNHLVLALIGGLVRIIRKADPSCAGE